MPRWDRNYYFVVFAAISAAIAYLVLLFVPLTQTVYTDSTEVVRRTLLAEDEVLPLLFSLVPIALAGSALLVVPRTGAPDKTVKINLWMSTFVIYVFIVLAIFSVGILFVPSAIFMTAAAAGSQVRRRQSRVFAASHEESKSGRGGGKGRRNKS
ncbi:MAG: hypothetical protein O3B95_03700 [Chloroflexi bacterium]|nr:hypothetical protein [Chloroflexota bacterium]